MKLLGWMHRKFRQNSNETTKDFSIGITGQPSLEELQYYPRGSNCSSTKPFSKAQRDNQYRNSFNSLDIAKMEDYHEEEEEQSNALTELFHGFLAIGTLGTEPITAIEPATPTFSISVEHIAEKETQVTEDELKLINEELEKVLGAEVDESYNVSSARNSHVSGGRISHCSSVTLNGKPMEASEGNGNGAIVCPLQSYLLGSAIELPDTSPTVVKIEHRTSLGELFQKAKLTEENCGSKSDRDEKRVEKEADKSALHLMKKMLKKRLIHAAAEKKLHKIRHIFNRKVHPESSMLSEQSHKPTKNEIKNDNAHWIASAEDITIYPQGTVPKEKTWSFNNQPPSSQFEYSSDDTSCGNEVWVKTDADYLVLEL